MKIVSLAFGLLSALIAGQSLAADTAVFAGLSSASRTSFGFVGGTKATNGDIAKDGLLLRGLLYSGRYDYDTVGVAGGKVDGKIDGVEVAVGYQWLQPNSRFSVYGGLDHQRHRLSPDDPGNSVKGGKTGALVQAEIETMGLPWYGNVIAKYSDPFNAHWVRGRLGYGVGSVVIGPEVINEGSTSFRENRYGLFLDVPVSGATSLSFSAGHRKSRGDGAREDQTGGYVDAGFAIKF